MTKYRIETLEELKLRKPDYKTSYQTGWISNGHMERLMGSELKEKPIMNVGNFKGKSFNFFKFGNPILYAFEEESLIIIEENDDSDEPTITKTNNKSKSNKNSKEMSQQEVKFNWSNVNTQVAKKFVKHEDIVKIMQLGISTGKNVFLFGRGGHGKSEITDEVFKHLGKEPFVQSCGDGLTEEKLFGGLNLKIFQDTGDIFFNVENSFMNSEYVILEEFLDAPMNVLLSLKDILTSGEFRQGSQRFKIKTKCVIALTNRTKEEVSEDDSIKALMERFPLGMLVEWDSYNRDDFMKLFRKVKSDKVKSHRREMQVLANIIAQSIDKGQFVSPRTAIHCLDIVINSGFESLVFIDGLDGDMVKETLNDFKRIERIANVEDKLNKLDKSITKSYKEFFNIEDDDQKKKELIKKVKSDVNKVSEMEVEDDNVNLKEEILEDKTDLVKRMIDEFIS